jgi:hypothetical protein
MNDAIEKSKLLESIQKDTIHEISALKEQLMSKTNRTELELPYPWEEHFSEAQGIPYYYNPDSGVSSWEYPSESVVDTKMSLLDLVQDCDDLTHCEQNCSTTVAPSRRIEDDLIRKGLSYQNHREELQRLEEQRFAEENTGMPQITKLADKMYGSRGEGRAGNLSIAERSKRMLEAKKAKEDKLRKEMELREAQEVRCPWLYLPDLLVSLVFVSDESSSRNNKEISTASSESKPWCGRNATMGTESESQVCEWIVCCVLLIMNSGRSQE